MEGQRPPRKGRTWGLRDTKDLTSRAAICAGCHVGEHSADGLTVRDVNHDLIAAGHPRLNFEFSAFLDNMPAHWDEKDENAGAAGPSRRAADFPARAWAIGRLTTIKAALALLESRVAEVEVRPEPWSGTARRLPSGRHAGRNSPNMAASPAITICAIRRGGAGPRRAARRLGSLPWGTWVLPWHRRTARRACQPSLTARICIESARTV